MAKSPISNNFPREGAHNSVTAAQVEQMERERPHHTATIEYTIGGAIEGQVHTSIEADRTYAINRGHRILNQAANDLGREMQQAAQKPITLDFDQIKGEAQGHLAAQSAAQAHDHEETP